MSPPKSNKNILPIKVGLTVILLTFLFLPAVNFAQQSRTTIPDSIANKGYDYFIEKLDSDQNSPALDLFYSQCYLSKAMAEKNWPQAAQAYKNLIHKSDKSIRLIYADSMIAVASRSAD